MNYAAIKTVDVSNCKGIGASLFVSGCRNRCPGCFQPQTWDFSYGNLYTDETESEILGNLSQEHIKNFSFLGGDPFEKENLETVTNLARNIKDKFPDKKLYAWTGYLFENLVKDEASLLFLEQLDYLVDGPFDLNKKNIQLPLRGSENQRILDCQKSVANKCAVEIRYEDIV